MAKLEKYGGNPNCLIATPEINVYTLTDETDFILLGSDGIYDHLDNKQIKAVVQNESREHSETMSEEIKSGSFEHVVACCSASVNGVLRSAMESESTDNLSVVLLTFKHFQQVISQFEPVYTSKKKQMTESS
jgi:protein phosphatase 2C family protein 2/3